MDMAEYFASLPRGKEDKPILLPMSDMVYDFHDIDGLYFMLDRRLSGCMLFMWSKPMNGDISGRVTVDGREISGTVIESMVIMGGMWIAGIPLRGVVTEYGRSYQLHVEGFMSATERSILPPRARSRLRPRCSICSAR